MLIIKRRNRARGEILWIKLLQLNFVNYNAICYSKLDIGTVTI